jgi:hypothetical protein
MEALDGYVAHAIADLAQHTEVDADDIEVVSFQRVVWPNGAQGCPKPDLAYTQAEVEGYRIVLRIGESEFSYHGRSGHPPFRCDDPDLRLMRVIA